MTGRVCSQPVGRLQFRIHFTLPDGTEDSIIVGGYSPQEIRERADEELTARGGTDPWAEEVAA